jgi:hypothetical protein
MAARPRVRYRRAMTRLAKTILVVSLLVLGAGCGDDDDDDAPTIDGGGADAPAACNGVGQTCSPSDACPEGLKCYLNGDRGVCSTERPTCGGIVGAECMSETETLQCAQQTDSEQGICVTEDELRCICASAPDAVTSCASALLP